MSLKLRKIFMKLLEIVIADALMIAVFYVVFSLQMKHLQPTLEITPNILVSEITIAMVGTFMIITNLKIVYSKHFQNET